ncbi:MAG: cytochrome [Bacteroidetes bacterium]|nr:cytochrome [Bacteroidota bacterium]
MKKTFKKIGIGLIVIFGLIQFYHPERNLSNDQTNDISKKFPVPDSVQAILKTSCYDCHSNQTVYPWYANIQPVASWLGHHVNEGKEDLNFSEFSSYAPRRQYSKLGKIVHVLDEHEMPLSSYTLIHRDAVINSTQQMIVSNWVNALRDSMKAVYPADSLKMPKRPKRD